MPPTIAVLRRQDPEDDEPTEEHPRIDPLVRLLVDTFKTQAEGQDRRHEALLHAYDERDAKRDTQHGELVAVVGRLAEQVGQSSTEVRGLAEKVSASTTEVRLLAAKAPDRKMLWALGAFVCLCLMVLIGLYAQANGDDAGRAIDDARRGMAPMSAPVDTEGP